MMGLLMVTRVCVRETDRERRRGFGGAGSDQNLWQGLLEYLGDDCYCTHPARRSPTSVICSHRCWIVSFQLLNKSQYEPILNARSVFTPKTLRPTMTISTPPSQAGDNTWSSKIDFIN